MSDLQYMLTCMKSIGEVLHVSAAGVCKEHCLKHSRGGLLPGSSGTHWQQTQAESNRSSGLAQYPVECGCSYTRPITGMPLSQAYTRR